MNIIVKLGAGYGLQINWTKVELLAVRCAPALKNGLGSILPCKSSIVYLGASVDTSGSIQSELNRRIGLAYVDLNALTRIWNHANLTREWKYRIYTACILTKLLYGLQTAWLTKTQRKTLDGFHPRCVRIITGAKLSFWSRVSNAEVLASINAPLLSAMLLEQQLKYFGKVYRRMDADITRTFVFQPSSDQLVEASFRKRRGRPRLSWALELRKHAIILIGNQPLGLAMQSEHDWRLAVQRYCGSPK